MSDTLQGRTVDPRGMRWTGVIMPGEEETELWGDIDEIYAQIFAINPNYQLQDVSNFELGKKGNSTIDLGTSTDVEASAVLKCAVMATANQDHAHVSSGSTTASLQRRRPDI